MGATSPDALPWPPGYAGVPADVPNDIQKLATATQTALNKKLASAISTAVLTAHSGFIAAGGASVARRGRFVVCRGIFQRAANLPVVDEGLYQYAVIPAGFRPDTTIYMAGTWHCLNTGLTPDSGQTMAMEVRALPTGELQFVANVNGTLRTGGDYVSAGGLTWWTP